MRIVLDAMGSDDCPDPEVHAAIEAAHLYGEEVLLVGPIEQLKPKLQALAGENPPVQLIHASDVITMEDKGLALALKAKKRDSKTSMAVGIDLVKNGQADAFVTAGNTGGAMATAYYRLGLVPGLERPGLTGIFPVKGGRCIVVDIGTNPECKPEHLLQFAVMGSIYARTIHGIASPRIGLLSNGEEAGKGNELVKGTFPLLEASGLNFFGNVEGKEIFGGCVDVVVTDGFSGNELLKTSEAVAKLLVDVLKEELMGSLRTKIGAGLAKPAFDKLRRMLDPAEVGAALLIGVNGLVFIGHGRSNARALVSAIRLARHTVEANLLGGIQTAIQEQISKLPKQEPA
jgi:glycerol-3-phosphate acyltransferase PlsX